MRLFKKNKHLSSIPLQYEHWYSNIPILSCLLSLRMVGRFLGHMSNPPLPPTPGRHLTQCADLRYFKRGPSLWGRFAHDNLGLGYGRGS